MLVYVATSDICVQQIYNYTCCCVKMQEKKPRKTPVKNIIDVGFIKKIKPRNTCVLSSVVLWFLTSDRIHSPFFAVCNHF